MGEKCGALVFPALQMWISHDHPQTNTGCLGYRNILLIPTDMHSFPQNCSFCRWGRKWRKWPQYNDWVRCHFMQRPVGFKSKPKITCPFTLFQHNYWQNWKKFKLLKSIIHHPFLICANQKKKKGGWGLGGKGNRNKKGGHGGMMVGGTGKFKLFLLQVISNFKIPCICKEISSTQHQ